jgi:hypothetical protein
MRKTIKFFSLLLALLLVLQLTGAAAGEVCADGAPDADAAVGWAVSAKDAEGNELTLTSFEEVASALGDGFALDYGKTDEGTPVTAPTVADLRRSGVKITPPKGCSVSSLLIVAEGEKPAEGSRSLLTLARASTDGSGAVTLPAAIFAEGFDASSVGTIFNGSGSSYVLRVTLEKPAPAAEITLSYTAGALASALGDTALVAGGNTVTLPIESDTATASGKVAALDDAVADTAMNTLGKQFTGWKLILPGGAFAPVQPGDSITLSSSAKLEAQWKDYTVKRSVTFSVDSLSREYDGTALVPSSFKISSGSLAEGHEAVAVYHGQQTLPGSSTASAAFTIEADDGTDVTDQYEINVINGSLTVKVRSEKQPITVTIRNTEKEYDGTADVTASYSITEGALLGNDTLSAKSFTGSITGVGSGSVNGSFAVLSGTADVSENYEITVVPGTLTVKPRAIVLTADSAEKDFDGAALTRDSFTLSSGTLIADHQVSASVKGSQTTAGSSPNKIDAASVKVTDGEGKNVTALYSIRLVDGTLTVKGPASLTALTITMKSAEKLYDGKALTSNEYEISSGELAAGDKLVLGKVTGEQTEAGECSVSAVFTVMRGENDVTASYTLTIVPGKLTVKQRDITLTAASANKIYDGRPLTRDSWKLTSGELVKGHKLTASVSGSQTDIGSSANVVVKNSIKITDGSGKDVTKNYNITTAAGTLTVERNPITPITLSVGNANKVYDGKAYRFLASDITVSSGTLPAGYTIEATFNPEAPTDVGKYDVTIKSVTIRDGSGSDVTNRFNITRAKGTLTITQRPLVIETKAANKVYDGTPLTERSTPTITGRADGHQVTLRITGSQTKVGSSENTVSDVKITDKETGADVTKNYAISYQYGLLTVSDASGDGGGAADPYSWVSGSSGTLYIKFDHAYDGFEGLQIDGKDLDRSVYTSASGSTDIWLKASYLNTLSSGSHTLTAKYAGGETVKTSFSIKGSQSTRTGDGSRLGLWIAIMAVALLASFAVAWYLFLGKDRRWKKRPIRKSK